MAQSASTMQAPRHALVPQVNGKQDVVVGVLQIPAPSQVARPVNIVPEQVGFLQLVPVAYFWQAPPAHLPLVPQLAAP